MSNTEEQTTELAVAEQSAPSRSDYDFKLTDPGNMSLANIVALSKLAAKGGMSDPKGAEGLAIRSVFGVQMGFTPVEGMQGLYLIEGKPVVGAQLLAKRVKQSEKYDYRVVRHDGEVCELEGFEIVDGQKVSLGTTSFTLDQAKAAGLTGKAIWQKWPKNMLFARAMADMHRFNMPDLIGSGFITDGEELVRDEVNPVVDTAAKAMEAATERAKNPPKSGKKKDEPKPEENVIEVEFTPEDPSPAPPGVTEALPSEPAPDQEPEPQVQPEPEVITSEPDDTLDQPEPQPISEGVTDPFESLHEAGALYLRETTRTKEGKLTVYYEIAVKATGDPVPGLMSTDLEAMKTATESAAKLWELDDKALAAKAIGTTVEAKMATKIREFRGPGAATVEELKSETDGAVTASLESLKADLGDEKFAGVVSWCAGQGVDLDKFVVEALPAIVANEKYAKADADGKGTQVNFALLTWAKKEKAAK